MYLQLYIIEIQIITMFCQKLIKLLIVLNITQ